MGCRVTIFVEDIDGTLETHNHKLEYFPNWNDMKRLCKRDRVPGDDFRHRKQSETFYVGDVIRSGGYCGSGGKGRRALKFFVRCDKPVTYKELVR